MEVGFFLAEGYLWVVPPPILNQNTDLVGVGVEAQKIWLALA